MEYSTRFDVFKSDTGHRYRFIFSGDIAYGDPVKDEVVSATAYRSHQNAFNAGVLKLQSEVRARIKMMSARARLSASR